MEISHSISDEILIEVIGAKKAKKLLEYVEVNMPYEQRKDFNINNVLETVYQVGAIQKNLYAFSKELQSLQLQLNDRLKVIDNFSNHLIRTIPSKKDYIQQHLHTQHKENQNEYK